MANRILLWVMAPGVLLGAVHCADHSFMSPDYGTDSARNTEDSNAETETTRDTETTDLDSQADSETHEEIPPRFDVAETLSKPADFKQSDGVDGLVVIEAEDFTLQVEATDGSAWKEVTVPDNYSGTGAMQATPPEYEEHKPQNNAQSNAPMLVYTVEFVKADPVYVWARASHADGFTDSVWFGKNGVIEGTSPLSFFDDEHEVLNDWLYIHLLMDGGEAVLDIPKVGLYTFDLYMREPSFVIDKIVLTTNSNFDPQSAN